MNLPVTLCAIGLIVASVASRSALADDRLILRDAKGNAVRVLKPQSNGNIAAYDMRGNRTGTFDCSESPGLCVEYDNRGTRHGSMTFPISPEQSSGADDSGEDDSGEDHGSDGE